MHTAVICSLRVRVQRGPQVTLLKQQQSNDQHTAGHCGARIMKLDNKDDIRDTSEGLQACIWPHLPQVPHPQTLCGQTRPSPPDCAMALVRHYLETLTALDLRSPDTSPVGA